MFAIAEFGSVCRKNHDAFSDNDLLVICDRLHSKHYYEFYTERGYSVSLFSETQLYSMKNKGSLFLQHLKLESNIICDNEGMFEIFLNSCSLIKPSMEELTNCQKTIENLFLWPNFSLTIAWKADFLYTSSRDYLIKLLAKNSIISFGLDSIIYDCSILFSKNVGMFEPLFFLREIKSTYRAGKVLPSVDKIVNAISAWVEVLQNEFGFSHQLLNNRNPKDMRVFNSNYERLRYLEVNYIILRNVGYKHYQHKELVGCILKPNLYHSLKESKAKAIEKYLNELKTALDSIKIDYDLEPLSSNIIMN